MIDFITVTNTQNQIQLSGAPVVDLVAIFTIPSVLVGWLIALKTRHESVRANTLSSLPIITFDIDSLGRLSIRNIGKSAATNVKIDPFYQPTYDDFFSNKTFISKLSFGEIPILNVDESILPDTSLKNGSIWGKEMLEFSMLNPKIDLLFSIRYRDLTGKRFVVRVKVNEGGVGIVEYPRYYKVFQKIKFYYCLVFEMLALNIISKRTLNKMKKARYSNK